MILMKAMDCTEYAACMDNLGLLEGEKKELEYIIAGAIIGRGDGSELGPLFQRFIDGSIDSDKTATLKNGLLVFTNVNLIFIQQEDYLRLVVLLDQLSGMGCFAYGDHFAIGVVTVDGYEYAFDLYRTEVSSGRTYYNEVSRQIQKFGMEQKRLAREGIAAICEYCGARNKVNQSSCLNCGAPLT